MKYVVVERPHPDGTEVYAFFTSEDNAKASSLAGTFREVTTSEWDRLQRTKVNGTVVIRRAAP